jgi:cytosine/creatinine deaminase
MRIATLLALKSYQEGGCPIGAVIIDQSKQIIGKGHNQLVQENDSTTHGETAALRDAGRVAKLQGEELIDFRTTTLFTSLTPCEVCCAQIKNRCNFTKVVIGDITNASSTESMLRAGENGIKNILILEDPKAIALYKEYSTLRSDLHYLDWHGHKALNQRFPNTHD